MSYRNDRAAARDRAKVLIREVAELEQKCLEARELNERLGAVREELAELVGNDSMTSDDNVLRHRADHFVLVHCAVFVAAFLAAGAFCMAI